MIFETPSKDFIVFRTTYNLRKKSFTIMELMKELDEFKAVTKARNNSGEANVVEESPSTAKANKKKKKNKKSAKISSIPPKPKENKKKGKKKK